MPALRIGGRRDSLPIPTPKAMNRFLTTGQIPRMVILLALTLAATLPAWGQLDAKAPLPVVDREPELKLQFSFSGAPWREVINWLADEGNLAVHMSDLPTGSFTYTDPGLYSHQEAVTRVNLFLLPQGFALVRSGSLLSVINLSDPAGTQQLDALASFVAIDQLAARPSHDVVKCLFPLGELNTEEAVQELSALNLMTAPKVFAKTNQLMITDTAAKLLNVKSILDSFQPSELANGTVVKSFALTHVNAEDVLVVARPHLGLATGEMIGIDVSVSADLQGKSLYVTGVPDKVKMIEGLVAAIDRPAATTPASESMELKSYPVPGGNVETVYNVLQTLLAKKSVRLSMDETAGSVVALASEEVHKEIAATVNQIQATDADFEVIPLKHTDPYFVVSLLEEMLDLPDAFDDPDEIDPDAPKIDADPDSMRLFVRAKRHQIDQIKKIVEGLDGSSTVVPGGASKIRIFPLTGPKAEPLLETAANFWEGGNPIILYKSSVPQEPVASERVVSEGVANQTLIANHNAADALEDQRWLSNNPDSKLPVIRCQITARGVLMQSEDPDALDRFEEHLRMIAGPLDAAPSPPTVFYLKYTPAVEALKMLAELLDGAESATDGEGGSLVNGLVSTSSSSYLGSLVTSRDGTTTMIAGSMTVLADTRLNRLIAQGTANDIEQIEALLRIVDKDRSITSIETYGTSRVIELQNSRASEVASAIRDAFAGRVAAAVSQPQAKVANNQQRGENPAQDKGKTPDGGKEAKDSKAKQASTKQQQGGAKGGTSLEPKMTVAVHEPSNSLIVTAPEPLFLEVERLVHSIDKRGEQAVEVITPVNGELIESVLLRVLLGETDGSTRNPLSRTSASSRSPSSSSRAKSSNR